MTFRTIQRTDLQASRSPFRVVDENQRELRWINRFLDALCVSGTAPLTLRSYANQLLHFVRWWSRQPGVDVVAASALKQFTESTLVDYVRDQVNEIPSHRRRTSTCDRACCAVCSGFIFSRTCRMHPI